MSSTQGISGLARQSQPKFTAIPASRYTMEQLTELYNQTRVDYLVPMPMNSHRLGEYVHNYDIDMNASYVALNEDYQVVGLGMLGVRNNRSWITRLGVLPVERRGGTGQFIMDALIGASRAYGLKFVQLEVIKGNAPAHALFVKNGFRETRELLVIRRPPSAHQARAEFEDAQCSELTMTEIETFLAQRQDGVAWTEESISLIRGGSLKGFRLETSSGHHGIAVFQQTAFQMQHIVLSAQAENDVELATALLYHLHRLYPLYDTKVENVPLESDLWLAYQNVGYVDSFRRIEMVMTL